MSFAQRIKYELLNKEFSIEEAFAFIDGIIATSGIWKLNEVTIKLNRDDVSNSIRELLDDMKVKHYLSTKNKNWVVLKDYKKDYKIKLAGPFFAGTFVGSGSISDLSTTSYHLEIQFYSNQDAEICRNFLNNKTINFKFKWVMIQRRLMWVIYIKKSDQISDFLKAIGAQVSMFSFEEQRIDREYNNQINRYGNLDTFNQQKLATSSIRFSTLWNKVQDNHLEDLFNSSEIIFYKLKHKNSFSSLSELVILLKDKYGIIKTKSGLNHWLIKLRKICESNL